MWFFLLFFFFSSVLSLLAIQRFKWVNKKKSNDFSVFVFFSVFFVTVYDCIYLTGSLFILLYLCLSVWLYTYMHMFVHVYPKTVWSDSWILVDSDNIAWQSTQLLCNSFIELISLFLSPSFGLVYSYFLSSLYSLSFRLRTQSHLSVYSYGSDTFYQSFGLCVYLCCRFTC